MYEYPKQILTISEQIQSYVDAGMIIDSYENVENAMKSIGYYRLRGYLFQFYNNDKKEYIQGTRFENILKIYYFDQKLSNIIFSMISKIEVALKVRLVESLLIYKDPLIYKDSSVFKDKKKYWQNLSSISSEIARDNDVFIKHNFDKHEGEIPIWAVVEVISFGTLSKIIKNLYTGEGSPYSILSNNYKYLSKKGNLVKPSQKMFTSWIQSVSILRNICAHNSRIYNRTIHTTPEIIDTDKTIPKPEHNGLYQLLLAMKYLRTDNNQWNEFTKELANLIEDNKNILSLDVINFPLDWKEHLYV